jgi:hypothetical protein
MTDMPQRDANGHWLKGTSGNPLGKPARIHEIEKLAREHSVAALNKIVALLNSKDDRVALAAANSLLDRGFGKPPLAVQAETVKWDMGALYLEALKMSNAERQNKDAPPMRIIEGKLTPITPPLPPHSMPALHDGDGEDTDGGDDADGEGRW